MDYFAFMVATARAQFPTPVAPLNRDDSDGMVFRAEPTAQPAHVAPCEFWRNGAALTVTLRAVVRTGEAT